MSFTRDIGTEKRRHDLLADLAESCAQRLVEKQGMTEEAAADVGNAIADFVADHWKGQTFYLPADQAYRLNERDWEIFRRMERGAAADLAMEFGITKVRVYQVYKRCLEEYRRRTQHALFETPEPSINEEAR
jgi:Mor family transcriptional regulator